MQEMYLQCVVLVYFIQRSSGHQDFFRCNPGLTELMGSMYESESLPMHIVESTHRSQKPFYAAVSPDAKV